MRSINELPPIERLAIEQAVFSKLGDDVSTKNPDSLRSMCDAEVIGNYRNMGAKSYDINVNGQKVGTYSVRMSKERPATEERKLVVENGAQLVDFVQSGECREERAEYIALMAHNFAEWMLETYGIVADGCKVVSETVHATPPQVLGTTLRVDADKVGRALVGYLPTTIAGFIGGGDDE